MTPSLGRPGSGPLPGTGSARGLAAREIRTMVGLLSRKAIEAELPPVLVYLLGMAALEAEAEEQRAAGPETG